MTDAPNDALVLKDAAGNYFLVSLETLQRGRVPAERRGEIDQVIAAAQGGACGDDTQGYFALLGDVIGELVMELYAATAEKGTLKGLKR